MSIACTSRPDRLVNAGYGHQRDFDGRAALVRHVHAAALDRQATGWAGLAVGPDDFEWRWYWAVDAVGLDRAGAERLASVAGELDGVLVASPVDPRDWLLIRWDRATAEVWRRLGESPHPLGWPDNLRDGIGEWLEATADRSTSPDSGTERRRASGTDDAEWKWYLEVSAVSLDRSGAERLASVAAELDGVLVARPIDPREWLTEHWDPETAEEVWRRLGDSSPASGGPDTVRDRIREWLDTMADQEASPE